MPPCPSLSYVSIVPTPAPYPKSRAPQKLSDLSFLYITFIDLIQLPGPMVNWLYGWVGLLPSQDWQLGGHELCTTWRAAQVCHLAEVAQLQQQRQAGIECTCAALGLWLPEHLGGAHLQL